MKKNCRLNNYYCNCKNVNGKLSAPVLGQNKLPSVIMYNPFPDIVL